MQNEVRASRRVRNYLVQAGLPVTSRNCSHFKWGEIFFYVNLILLFPALTGWSKTSLVIQMAELLTFFLIPILLWGMTREEWPAFALNLRVNLLLFAMYLPIIAVIIALRTKKERTTQEVVMPHPAAAGFTSGLLSQSHLTHLFVLGLVCFCIGQFILWYTLLKREAAAA